MSQITAGDPNDTDAKYPYACDLQITFATGKQAGIALKVMQVDQEVGNRVRKSLCIAKDNDTCLKV